jgi:DNA repair protein RecO (recombination protein O)
VGVGEADLIVTLFTESNGLIGCVARGARRASNRFSALEPMHLLAVGVDYRQTSELGTLVEASIARPRLRLVGDLERLDIAGHALRWVRRACTPLTPEPEVWDELNALLDALDTEDSKTPLRARLATSGLRLLSTLGWGLNLESCVRCGRPCSSGASACVDPAAGGLVCRSCGGARVVLSADRRARLVAAASGDDTALEGADAPTVIELVDATLVAHAAGDRGA